MEKTRGGKAIPTGKQDEWTDIPIHHDNDRNDSLFDNMRRAGVYGANAVGIVLDYSENDVEKYGISGYCIACLGVL